MRLTTSGFVFLIAGIALIISAYRFSLPGMLPAGILLIGLVALSLLLAIITSRRMEVTLSAAVRSVDGTPVAEVGRPLLLRAALRNRTPLPIGPFGVDLAFRPGLGEDQGVRVPGIGASSSVTVEAECTPTQRGVSGVDGVAVSFEGPFGLSAVSHTLLRGYDIAVAPRLEQMPRPPKAGLAQPMADTSRALRGGTSRDFDTREYVPGDDLRHIHWTSTARHDELMVRHEAEEEHPFAVILLDTAGAGEHPDPAAEVLISAVQSLASVYFAAGYEVLCCIDGTLHPVRETRGAERLRLALASYETGGTELPGTLRGASGAADVAVCAMTPQRASALESALPRGTRSRRLIAADLDLDASGVDGVFATGHAIPQEWKRLGRRRR